MDKLRPMVATHLPFASTPETMYRAMSMFLLAQFYKKRKGLIHTFELEELKTTYKEVRQCNQSIVQRLRTLTISDASVNAIIKLDCFALMQTDFLDDDSIPELEPLFLPWFT